MTWSKGWFSDMKGNMTGTSKKKKKKKKGNRPYNYKHLGNREQVETLTAGKDRLPDMRGEIQFQNETESLEITWTRQKLTANLLNVTEPTINAHVLYFHQHN